MVTMGLPSFFKVLVPDFESILRIPPLFGKLFEHMLPENALLQFKSGETWPVKIERIDDHFCFTDGWPKIVNDLELQMGDFLVFWLMLGEKNSSCIFKVAMYGTTGCEKDLNPATTSHDPGNVGPQVIQLNLETTCIRPTMRSNTTHGLRRRRSKIIENEKRGHGAQISDDSVYDQKYFIQVLKKYNQYRMHVPMGFAKKTGLIHKSEVMLQNLNGGSWRVELQLYQNRMLFMCKGWFDFRKKNRLMLRNRYAFEFIPETESIQVQLVEKQRQPTSL